MITRALLVHNRNSLRTFWSHLLHCDLPTYFAVFIETVLADSANLYFCRLCDNIVDTDVDFDML